MACTERVSLLSVGYAYVVQSLYLSSTSGGRIFRQQDVLSEYSKQYKHNLGERTNPTSEFQGQMESLDATGFIRLQRIIVSNRLSWSWASLERSLSRV